jgi:hypothetical protein
MVDTRRPTTTGWFRRGIALSASSTWALVTSPLRAQPALRMPAKTGKKRKNSPTAPMNRRKARRSLELRRWSTDTTTRAKTTKASRISSKRRPPRYALMTNATGSTERGGAGC